jgi:hypothetical protein
LQLRRRDRHLEPQRFELVAQQLERFRLCRKVARDRHEERGLGLADVQLLDDRLIVLAQQLREPLLLEAQHVEILALVRQVLQLTRQQRRVPARVLSLGIVRDRHHAGFVLAEIVPHAHGHEAIPHDPQRVRLPRQPLSLARLPEQIDHDERGAAPNMARDDAEIARRRTPRHDGRPPTEPDDLQRETLRGLVDSIARVLLPRIE